MAKRTGLGRGIGSLIPTTENTNTRPVDVFFPNAPKADQPPEESAATVLAPPAPADEKSTTAGPKRRSASKGSTASAAKQTDEAEVADSDAVEELVAVPGARLIHIDPHAIVPNPRQPRREFDPNSLAELVHSVREFGLLQPVVVRETNDGAHELIMGERRTRAAREAGLDVIPAIVRDTADEDLLRDALLENLHRAELNPLEEASAYQQLLEDFGTTQDELARRIGRSRPQISNTIRLLRLPVPVQQRVAAGVLSAGHARAILSLESEELMARLADKIVNEDLSVRAAEAAAKAVAAAGETAAPSPRPKAGARRAYLDDVASRLGDRLNTRVKIGLGARKGQVTIDFATIQDLNRILAEIGEQGYQD
ncbi:MAG: ParB/RepB/Spo0J family partition protein [Microbacterium sp.]